MITDLSEKCFSSETSVTIYSNIPEDLNRNI